MSSGEHIRCSFENCWPWVLELNLKILGGDMYVRKRDYLAIIITVIVVHTSRSPHVSLSKPQLYYYLFNTVLSSQIKLVITAPFRNY